MNVGQDKHNRLKDIAVATKGDFVSAKIIRYVSSAGISYQLAIKHGIEFWLRLELPPVLINQAEKWWDLGTKLEASVVSVCKGVHRVLIKEPGPFGKKAIVYCHLDPVEAEAQAIAADIDKHGLNPAEEPVNLGQLLKEKLYGKEVDHTQLARKVLEQEKPWVDAIMQSNLCPEIILPLEEPFHSPLYLRPSGIGIHTHSIPQKEHSMTRNANNAIIRLADSKLSKDLADVGLLPVDIREALKEQMEQQAKTAAADAAKEIMGLLKTHDEKMEDFVLQLREVRAQEKRIKESMEALGKAKKYGLATSNFVPLALKTSKLFLFDLSEEQRALAEIDESKIPAEEKVAAQ